MPIEAPRDDLFRMHVHVDELRFEGDDGNTLVGYAAVFNETTRIDSWEGKFDEQIAPGAFSKTLNERGDKIKILFDHGMDPSIGNKPIASIDELVEDDYGLRLKATFIDRPYAADIKEAIRAKAIDGMSFRFSVKKDEWTEPDDDSPPVRTLKEVRLHELGPVTFPAYEATTAGVRSQSAFAAFVADRARVIESLQHKDSEEPPTGTPLPEPPKGTRINQRQPVLKKNIIRFLKEHS